VSKESHTLTYFNKDYENRHDRTRSANNDTKNTTNMTTTMIYIWGIADNIGSAFTIIAIVGLVLAGVLLLISGVAKVESAEDETVTVLLAGFQKSLTAGLIALIVAALMPSSKTIAAMVVIPELANSDVIKRDLPDIYAAAIGKLKAELGVQEEKSK
jgi:hypothetical protein